MNTQKTTIIILALIVVGIIVWRITAPTVSTVPAVTDDTNFVCSQEAQMCPDGTSVTRSGPDCAFAICPSTPTSITVNTSSSSSQQNPAQSPSSTKPNQLPVNGRVRAPVDLVLKNGQPQNGIGLTVQLQSVSDSRCPSDVQCIWAGTATASLKLSVDDTSKIVSINLGDKPTTYAGYEVSVIDINPAPKSGTNVSASNYRVTVHVASSYTNIVDNPDIVQGSTAGQICTNAGGVWDGTYRECGGVSESSCKQISGTWNECGSACRHNPSAEMCTMQCVQFCQL